MDHANATQPTRASARKPWDFHPALTEDRLRVCARLLANARRDAVAMASYELGDDAWSVGCRAYAFGRQRLLRVAEAGTHSWLRVMDDSHHFVFQIEGVPIRFYRGQADEPTPRTLRRQETEARQLSLVLGEDAAADGLVFRFAVETGATGGVDRVVFLALRGEDRPECFWPVPLDVSSVRSGMEAAQLRLIPDDGYGGPGQHDSLPDAVPPQRPRRERAGGQGGPPKVRGRRA